MTGLRARSKRLKELRRTLEGALWGLLATLVTHCLAFLVLAVAAAALGALAVVLIRLYGSPALGKALGLTAVLSLPAAGLLARVAGEALPAAGAGAVLAGLCCGGLLGLAPGLVSSRWWTALGAATGLLLHLLALLVVALVTGWAALVALPVYLCVGPLTGVVAAFLVRRAAPGSGP